MAAPHELDDPSSERPGIVLPLKVTAKATGCARVIYAMGAARHP